MDGSSKVVHLDDHFIAKYGPQVQHQIQEGLNMIFFNQNLEVPIARVYALYEENGNACLIMEYVAGRTLDISGKRFIPVSKGRF